MLWPKANLLSGSAGVLGGQTVAAAGGASGADASQAALSQVEALLAKDQAPFSATLHRLRAQLLLQLGRCPRMPALCHPFHLAFPC